MIEVYRLTKEKYIDQPLTTGSAMRGERWNPQGVEVLYTSSSPELALVEILANLMPIRLDQLPTYFLLTYQFPEDATIRTYRADELPAGWNDPVRRPELQQFFGDWLKGTEELAVRIPSAVVPFSYNYILHCKHALYPPLVKEPQPFTVDGRLVIPKNWQPVVQTP